MHPATRAFMEVGLATDIDAYLAARRRRFGYVRRLDDLLGRSGLLLTPTIASEGWYADGRLTLDDEPGMLGPERLLDGRPERDRPPGDHPAGRTVSEWRSLRAAGHGAASRG